MNGFAEELDELINKWRDMPATALEELIDVLESAAEKLAEEVNSKLP